MRGPNQGQDMLNTHTAAVLKDFPPAVLQWLIFDPPRAPRRLGNVYMDFLFFHDAGIYTQFIQYWTIDFGVW